MSRVDSQLARAPTTLGVSRDTIINGQSKRVAASWLTVHVTVALEAAPAGPVMESEQSKRPS